MIKNERTRDQHLRVFLDIETLPPPEDFRQTLVAQIAAETIASERATRTQADGRELISPRDIRESVEAGASDDSAQAAEIEQRFRRLALNGTYGRLLAVGLILERDGEIVQRGVLGRDRTTERFHLDEARTLRAFWRLLAAFDPLRDLLIGHNLLDFDLPFLYQRSIIHGVRPTISWCFVRFRAYPVFDTLREWTRWSWRDAVKLAELTRILGVPSPKEQGIDGSRIYDEFRAGRHAEIAAYCLRDVEAVRAVYRRIVFLDTKVSDLSEVAPQPNNLVQGGS